MINIYFVLFIFVQRSVVVVLQRMFSEESEQIPHESRLKWYSYFLFFGVLAIFIQRLEILPENLHPALRLALVIGLYDEFYLRGWPRPR